MKPFQEGDTFSLFQNLIGRVKGEIDSLENEYILNASLTELEEYFVDKVIIEPLNLDVENHYIKDKSGTDIDVSRDRMRAFHYGQQASVRGTNITIAIPYTGDDKLWRVRASTFSISGHPDIDFKNGELTFNVKFPDDSANTERITSEISQNIRSLADATNYLATDVARHNNSAPDAIKQHLERKREKALAVSGVVAALGIPIKRAKAEPKFTIPIKKREMSVRRPAPSVGEYKPEPILEESEYQYILSILRSMSLVIERNPKSFCSLDEESIRDNFLIQLNGHYEGDATGETFNASGKTDILIRAGDRNVFIAECKFWRGPVGFKEAIIQLLSYLTWRDTKAALFWLYEMLTDGELRYLWVMYDHGCEVIGEHAEPLKRIAHYELYHSYRAWLKLNGIKRDISRPAFGKFLRQFSTVKKSNGVTYNLFGPVEEIKKIFKSKLRLDESKYFKFEDPIRDEDQLFPDIILEKLLEEGEKSKSDAETQGVIKKWFKGDDENSSGGKKVVN